MELWEVGLLVIMGAWAATVNAAAGGGTYFTFPTLIFIGIPPILANTTNKVGLTFGAIASARGFRKEIAANRGRVIPLMIAGVIGSVCGSLLLLVTTAETFSELVPWLMLSATLVFAFGKRIIQWFKSRKPADNSASPSPLAERVGQWLIGVYGGFFGAGIGILLLALYEMMGIKNIHEMNGLKSLIASGVHLVSVATFVIAGVVVWPAAAAMAVGALIGGYYGALLTKRIPEALLRGMIIAYGLIVSGWFFFDVYA
ncbi:MAG: sulfite exporter TauE/SafE family protein [Rickettsiales bacterium]|nr:sulfite exporter TauE/SafE family protein [Rickettsiales bacterium]